MKLGDILTDYLRSLERSRSMLRSPGILLPFVFFAAIQCLILIACAFFTVPPLSSFMVPVVEWISGEQALHYPMHFILLPGTYHLIYLPLAVVVGFVLFGWAVFLMGDYFQRQGARTETRRGMARALPSMIIIGFVYVIAATAPPLFFNFFSASAPNPWLGRLLSALGVVLSMIFQVLLIYSLVFLRTSRRHAVDAIKRSVEYASRRFRLTFLLVATVYLLHRPVDFLLGNPDKIALKFDPEMVFFLLLSGIMLELVTNYLLFSATASIVLAKREDGTG